MKRNNVYAIKQTLKEKKKDQKQGDKYRKQNRLTNRACDKQNCLLGKIPVFLDNKDKTL